MCEVDSSLEQDKQWTYNVTLRRVTVTIVAVQKQSVLRIIWESVVSVIQHATRMHRILL